MLRFGKRRIAAAVAAGCLVSSVAVGSVMAANPNRAYDFRACWDGSQVQMTQTWSAFNVDEVSFGISGPDGGLGEQFAIPRSRSGSETSRMSPPDGSNTAAGDLRFRGKVVAFGEVRAPAGGWAALDPC